MKLVRNNSFGRISFERFPSNIYILLLFVFFFSPSSSVLDSSSFLFVEQIEGICCIPYPVEEDGRFGSLPLQSSISRIDRVTRAGLEEDRSFISRFLFFFPSPRFPNSGSSSLLQTDALSISFQQDCEWCQDWLILILFIYVFFD